MRSAMTITTATSAAAALLACAENPVEQTGDQHLPLSQDSLIVGVYRASPSRTEP